MSKDQIVRYAISSALTFVAAFAIAVAPFVADVSPDQAALFGLVMVGVRAGVKAVAEQFGFKG